jgi:hypothetical protein
MENEISQQQLSEILYNHELWLSTAKQRGVQANFANMILDDANLTGSVLIEADFNNASLREANLTEASLCGANFFDANLTGTNLTGSEATGVDFRRTSLTCANFTEANLFEASFAEANIIQGNFTGARLGKANFAGANLDGTNFTKASLTNANFAGANLENLFGVKFPPQNHEMIVQIAKIILENPSCLNMNQWHSTCKTTHCIAGWCSVLCGLEYEKQDGTRINAHAISSYVLGTEAQSHFYDSKEDALAWLRTKL